MKLQPIFIVSLLSLGLPFSADAADSEKKAEKPIEKIIKVKEDEIEEEESKSVKRSLSSPERIAERKARLEKERAEKSERTKKWLKKQRQKAKKNKRKK